MLNETAVLNEEDLRILSESQKAQNEQDQRLNETMAFTVTGIALIGLAIFTSTSWFAIAGAVVLALTLALQPPARKLFSKNHINIDR